MFKDTQVFQSPLCLAKQLVLMLSSPVSKGKRALNVRHTDSLPGLVCALKLSALKRNETIKIEVFHGQQLGKKLLCCLESKFQLHSIGVTSKTLL